MVRFEKPKNNLSQGNEAKTGRTIFHYRSTGTGDLQVATPGGCYMAGRNGEGEHYCEVAGDCGKRSDS